MWVDITAQDLLAARGKQDKVTVGLQQNEKFRTPLQVKNQPLLKKTNKQQYWHRTVPSE